MTASGVVSAIGLFIAGASGGILAEELFDGGDPNVLVPVIGFVLAMVIIAFGFSLARRRAP